MYHVPAFNFCVLYPNLEIVSTFKWDIVNCIRDSKSRTLTDDAGKKQQIKHKNNKLVIEILPGVDRLWHFNIYMCFAFFCHCHFLQRRNCLTFLCLRTDIFLNHSVKLKILCTWLWVIDMNCARPICLCGRSTVNVTPLFKVLYWIHSFLLDSVSTFFHSWRCFISFICCLQAELGAKKKKKKHVQVVRDMRYRYLVDNFFLKKVPSFFFISQQGFVYIFFIRI